MKDKLNTFIERYVFGTKAGRVALFTLLMASALTSVLGIVALWIVFSI